MKFKAVTLSFLLLFLCSFANATSHQIIDIHRQDSSNHYHNTAQDIAVRVVGIVATLFIVALNCIFTYKHSIDKSTPALATREEEEEDFISGGDRGETKIKYFVRLN